MTIDRNAILRRLDDVAITGDDGRRYVRRATACRVIGISEEGGKYWEDRGYINAVRVRVPDNGRRGHRARFARGTTICGLAVLWPLDQVAERVRRLRGQHRWSRADDELICAFLGQRSYAFLAERIGCSVEAVKHRARKLGVGLKSNAGLMTTGQISRIVERCPSTVARWCQEGLRHQAAASSQAINLIDPTDLAAFLRRRPHTWAKLSERARQRVAQLTPKRRRAA